MSRTPPLELPATVRYLAGDVLDSGAVEQAIDGVDVLVHCAFALDARGGAQQMARVNVEGTANVVAAAEAAGVSRAIFLSSVTVYGPRNRPDQPPSCETDTLTPHPDHPYALHKVQCEQIFAASSLPSVLVRAAIVLGRGTDNRLREAIAGRHHIVATGPAYPWCVIHHDDVARFLLTAADSDLTGPVNLAAADPLDQTQLAGALDRKVRKVPSAAMRKAAEYAGGVLHITPGEVETALRLPQVDTGLLRDTWKFEPGWTAAETATDTRLAAVGVTTRFGRVARRRGRTSYPHQIVPADVAAGDGAPLTHTGSDDLRGEFDTPIDARFPVYSQTNLAEALPGPSSALTLDVQGRGLRGTTSAVATILDLPGALGVEAAARLQGVHAHRMYINGSGAYHVALAMPGSNPESMAEQFTGTHADELPDGPESVAGTYRPPGRSKLATARAVTRVGVEIAALSRRAVADIAEVRAQNARLESYLTEVSDLPQRRIEVLLPLAADLLAYAWTVQGVVNLVSGAALEVASKTGSDDNLGHGDDLESSAALRGVRALAAQVAGDSMLTGLLADRGPGLADRVGANAPEFATQVDAAMERFGHRGPAEAEFDSRSFSEDNDAFLATIGRAALALKRETPTPLHKKHNWAQRLAVKMLTLREQNRDRCVRLTWNMRRLALEQGRRLAVQGRIDTARDVFNLTLAELIDPPPDVKDTVARRCEDRSRLAKLHMPPIFSGAWVASDVLPPMQAGDTITGVGICKGTVVGRARLVEPDTIDDLEPDEIMVAHVTDVGYTALFGHCGAVVTDIGGVMSHAAVVAREYGVPCVVDTQVAAARIKTGALVEVDGAAGTVTVLEPAPDDGQAT